MATKSEQEAYRKARDAAAAANKVMRKAIDDLFAELARVGMSYDDARTLFDRLVDDPPRGILLPTPARVTLVTYKTGGQGRLAPDVVYLSLVNGFDTMMEGYGLTDGWNRYAKVAEQTAQAFDSMVEELKNVEGRSDDDEDEYANAPLGKYAWPDDRIGMPLEKNTELEDRLFNAIVNHFDSNTPITEDDAKELQALLKMGLYKDVLKQPNVEFVYRGVKLKSDDVTKLTGQSEKELVKRLDDSGALFVVLPPVQKSPWRSRKGASVSWTTSSAKAKEFTGGLYTATGSWGVVAVAKVADNPDTFLAGVDGLYKLRTIGSIYEPEREALAIAPVKIHALRVYRPSTRVSSMLSNSNVKKANATKKEGIVKNVDRLMSAINEVVLKTNTYVLNSRDARLICKGEGSSMRVVHDGDTVHDLGESMKNVDGVHVRKVRLDEGFVGWVEWNAFEPTDKATISENQAPWTVRKGETVLVRQSDGKRDSWKPHVLKKVTYFTDDELVERPDNNWGNRRTWVFQRGNWKCAVREEQFFAKPE